MCVYVCRVKRRRGGRRGAGGRASCLGPARPRFMVHGVPMHGCEQCGAARAGPQFVQRQLASVVALPPGAPSSASYPLLTLAIRVEKGGSAMPGMSSNVLVTCMKRCVKQYMNYSTTA